MAGATLTTWFPPNMARRSEGKEAPPDLVEDYRRMRMAKRAILFLAFYPGQKGQDCNIGEAVDIGLKDRKLIVAGAVSSPNALPKLCAQGQEETKPILMTMSQRSTRTPSRIFANVETVRASRIDDRTLLKDFRAS